MENSILCEQARAKEEGGDLVVSGVGWRHRRGGRPEALRSVSATETEIEVRKLQRQQTVTGTDSACEKCEPTWLEGVWPRHGKLSIHLPM